MSQEERWNTMKKFALIALLLSLVVAGCSEPTKPGSSGSPAPAPAPASTAN